MLLRLNFHIVSSQFRTGFIDEGVFIVQSEVVETIEDEGFFSFVTEEKSSSRKFTLILTEESHESTRVILEDDKGNFDSSPEGARFLSLLYEQLK